MWGGLGKRREGRVVPGGKQSRMERGKYQKEEREKCGKLQVENMAGFFLSLPVLSDMNIIRRSRKCY